MPKFTQVDTAFLKKTMLPRAPDCYFTPGDVDLITKETGLDMLGVHNWAKCFRWRMKTSFGHDVASIQEYLKASEESLVEKVIP